MLEKQVGGRFSFLPPITLNCSSCVLMCMDISLMFSVVVELTFFKFSGLTLFFTVTFCHNAGIGDITSHRVLVNALHIHVI